MGQKLFWRLINRLIRWRFPHIRHLSVQELHQRLEQSQQNSPTLLDARTLAEYKVSHLYQAYRIPDSLESLKERLNLTPDDPIVIYCSIGYRSALAVTALQKQGYHQVFNLNGSLFQWVTEGYDVYQAQQVVQQIHPYNRYWKWLLSLMLPHYKLIQD